MANNRVQLADGTVLIDITDTTAVASDVAAGKYFYNAAGVRTQGTGSDGNVFVITVSKNSQTGYWEPDCTWSELSTAYNAGKTIVIESGDSNVTLEGWIVNKGGGSISYGYCVNELLDDGQDPVEDYWISQQYFTFDGTGLVKDADYTYYDTGHADATSADVRSGKIAYGTNGRITGAATLGNTIIFNGGLVSQDDDGQGNVELEFTGSTGPTEPTMLDVDFIDYDGTLLYSYSAADFLALTAMPANPTHDGLTAQGWNWTLADAKDYVQSYGMLVIGQNYVTTNGKTKAYINLNDVTHDLTRKIEINLTAGSSAINGSIDWGDGNTTSFSSKTGSFAYSYTYSAYGNYVIQIESNGEYYLGYNGSNRAFISYGTHHNQESGAFFLEKVELGQYVAGFCRMAFQHCYALESISWCTTAVNWKTSGSGDNLFGACPSLKGLVFPSGLTSFSLGGITAPQALRGLSLPKTITAFPGLGSTNIHLRKITSPPIATCPSFNYYYALEYLILPGTYTTIASDYLRNLISLKKFTIPASVTTMSGSSAFGYPFRLRELHCEPTTPPAINNTVINRLPSDCVIYVPYSADHSILDAYKAATNWSAGASKMVEEGGP